MNKLHSLYILFGLVKSIRYLLLYFINRKGQSFASLDIEYMQFNAALSTNFSYSRALFSNYINLTVAIDSNSYRLKMRLNSSDFKVAKQIFIRQEYLEAISQIKNKLKIENKLSIVDCGANAGYSAVYFNEHFSNPNLIALEPFDESFELLRKNINLNKLNINLIKGALWKNNEKLKFQRSFRDKKEWSVQTVEAADGIVKAVTIENIMQNNNINIIDILKIDIEGSEFEVFLNSNENVNALERIKSIVMEIHDDIGDRQKLYNVFIDKKFELIELGELTLFLNSNYIQ